MDYSEAKVKGAIRESLAAAQLKIHMKYVKKSGNPYRAIATDLDNEFLNRLTDKTYDEIFKRIK